jgi:hypothetical protein
MRCCMGQPEPSRGKWRRTQPALEPVRPAHPPERRPSRADAVLHPKVVSGAPLWHGPCACAAAGAGAGRGAVVESLSSSRPRASAGRDSSGSLSNAKTPEGVKPPGVLSRWQRGRDSNPDLRVMSADSGSGVSFVIPACWELTRSAGCVQMGIVRPKSPQSPHSRGLASGHPSPPRRGGEGGRFIPVRNTATVQPTAPVLGCRPARNGRQRRAAAWRTAPRRWTGGVGQIPYPRLRRWSRPRGAEKKKGDADNNREQQTRLPDRTAGVRPTWVFAAR